MKCDYCQVINGAKERPGGIIYQNPYIIVFLGSQHHKGHTAVVLRKHKTDLLELSKSEREYFFDFMLEIAKAVKRAISLINSIMLFWVIGFTTYIGTYILVIKQIKIGESLQPSTRKLFITRVKCKKLHRELKTKYYWNSTVSACTSNSLVNYC